MKISFIVLVILAFMGCKSRSTKSESKEVVTVEGDSVMKYRVSGEQILRKKCKKVEPYIDCDENEVSIPFEKFHDKLKSYIENERLVEIQDRIQKLNEQKKVLDDFKTDESEEAKAVLLQKNQIVRLIDDLQGTKKDIEQQAANLEKVIKLLKSNAPVVVSDDKSSPLRAYYFFTSRFGQAFIEAGKGLQANASAEWRTVIRNGGELKIMLWNDTFDNHPLYFENGKVKGGELESLTGVEACFIAPSDRETIRGAYAYQLKVAGGATFDFYKEDPKNIDIFVSSSTAKLQCSKSVKTHEQLRKVFGPTADIKLNY